MMKRILLIPLIFFLSCLLIPAQADSEELPEDFYENSLDYAQVVAVKAVLQGETWTFSVTVRHNDEGWNHYANVWQVINPKNGDVLGERILAHPHEDEQPFYRSQSGIKIDDDISAVLVRAGCTIHGFGGRELLVRLDKEMADGEVQVILPD